ncbi:MAG: hypothetical protein JJV98_14140 [Desulfosarcina sp.]|nr:hypothetical protein [Desulfobacterales bacterium]
MRVKSAMLILALLSVIVTIACSSGPSEKEVKATLEGVLAVLDILPDGLNEGVAAGFQDSDVVEFTFNNEDFTIVQDARLDLNRDSGQLNMEMVWILEDYEDPQSGHALNGTIALSSSGNILEQSTSDEELELAFDLNFSGGAVRSVAFIINQDDMASETIPNLMVNGQPYTFAENISLSTLVSKGFSALRIR